MTKARAMLLAEDPCGQWMVIIGVGKCCHQCDDDTLLVTVDTTLSLVTSVDQSTGVITHNGH